MDINKYTYQVSWSEEDQEYVATVAEFPSLSWLDADRHQAERGLIDLVTEVVEDMEASGEAVPVPLGSRNYSGSSTCARLRRCIGGWLSPLKQREFLSTH